MDEIHKLGIIVVPITWLVGIITALVMYFVCSDAIKWIWTKSYILGLATSLMTFGLTLKGGKSFLREVSKPSGSGEPVRKTILSYIFRLAVAAAVCVAVILNQQSNNPKFNIVPTIIGYLTLKVVLIIVTIIKRGKVKVDDEIS